MNKLVSSISLLLVFFLVIGCVPKNTLVKRGLSDSELALLKSSVSSNKLYHGTAYSGADKKSYNIKIAFTSYDQQSGVVHGEFHWVELKSVHAFEGKLNRSGIIVKENKYIKRGNTVLGCIHKWIPETSRTLKGHYKCGNYPDSSSAIHL